MSNHLAIATVTGVLKRELHNALTADFSGTGTNVDVTHARPESPTNGSSNPTVNIYLYHVSPNPALNNVDLPTRSPSGLMTQRPSVALDLHYIFTFYGNETKLEPQQLMGSSVRMLEANPVLTREMISDTLADVEFDHLDGSDLAQAVERVRFTPEALSLDELSKLWGMFYETKYNLSLAYRASVVLIEAHQEPRRVLPVAARSISLAPSVSGAAAVSPDKIAGLQIWLKSDAGLTYDKDGVSLWADQSGNGNDAEQTDADRRPELAAHGPGNKPVLRFDGDDDYLAIKSLSYSTAGQIPAITVCALVCSKSDERQIIASFDADIFWRLGLRDGTAHNVGWDTTDSTGTRSDLRSDNSYTDSRWHLICATFSASDAPDKRLVIDGKEVASATSHGGNAVGASPTSTRFGFIGTGSAADAENGDRNPEWHLHGDLAEFIVFHHAVSDGERMGLESYFIERYRQ